MNGKKLASNCVNFRLRSFKYIYLQDNKQDFFEILTALKLLIGENLFKKIGCGTNEKILPLIIKVSSLK